MTQQVSQTMPHSDSISRILFRLLQCYCIFSPFAGWGQTVFLDNPPYLPQKVVEQLAEQTDTIRKELQKEGFEPMRFDILKIGKQLFLCPDGHFNVYTWKEGHWININRQPGLGYNFGAKKFVFKDQIHAYGGYGFWRTHGDVLRFNEKDSCWNLLNFTAGLKGGIARFTGKGLYVYGPLAYYINLEDEKIYTIKSVMIPATKTNRPDYNTLDLGDYTFQKDQALFIDPQAQTVYISEVALSFLEGGNLMQKKYFLHLKGDSLTSMNCENKSVTQYAFPVITGPVVEAELRDQSVNSLYFLLAGALLILAVFSIRMIRKKRMHQTGLVKEDKLIREEMMQTMINAMVSAQQRQYSSQQLDELIQQFETTPSASFRSKRIQCIQEMNKIYMNLYGKELIKRTPDPNDGRKNIYEINP